MYINFDHCLNIECVGKKSLKRNVLLPHNNFEIRKKNVKFIVLQASTDFKMAIKVYGISFWCILWCGDEERYIKK